MSTHHKWIFQEYDYISDKTRQTLLSDMPPVGYHFPDNFAGFSETYNTISLFILSGKEICFTSHENVTHFTCHCMFPAITPLQEHIQIILYRNSFPSEIQVAEKMDENHAQLVHFVTINAPRQPDIKCITLIYRTRYFSTTGQKTLQ
ncbi:MAG TPA: hypothetical protein DCR43_07940 [Bacteroidales bacterium]|nr:MAG: hypothetical protein A2X09_08025 [Bacteroidetes bacterium GWF2_43_11]HAQ65764.1 hypothetical protein [Bacteroidales bacterium]HBZ67226.1 hypothetical protein [Bacteroidales bacterium]